MQYRAIIAMSLETNKIFKLINVNAQNGREMRASLFNSKSNVDLIKKPKDSLEMTNHHLIESLYRNDEGARRCQCFVSLEK